jgi:hypothetical protein
MTWRARGVVEQGILHIVYSARLVFDCAVAVWEEIELKF